MTTPKEGKHSSFLSGPAGMVFCAFAAIAVFFLLAEHRAHLGYIAPYLSLVLVGICLVLHLFMHRLVHGDYSTDAPDRHLDNGKRGLTSDQGTKGD